MNQNDDNMEEMEPIDDIAMKCIAVCEEKKAADIVLFDVRENNSVADYYLLCCGNSLPHIRALADYLRRSLLDCGFRQHGQDGSPSSQWIVLDFGIILIHIMTPEMRRFYCLEDLWNRNLVVYTGGEPLPEHSEPVQDDDWGDEDEDEIEDEDWWDGEPEEGDEDDDWDDGDDDEWAPDRWEDSDFDEVDEQPQDNKKSSNFKDITIDQLFGDDK